MISHQSLLISTPYLTILVMLFRSLIVYAYIDIIFVGFLPPTNVRATVLTPRSVEVTWTVVFSSPDVTGYLISYTTTAECIHISRSVMVSGNSATSITISNLEENTRYTISVQATTNDGRSGISNTVSVTTYTDGK